MALIAARLNAGVILVVVTVSVVALGIVPPPPPPPAPPPLPAPAPLPLTNLAAKQNKQTTTTTKAPGAGLQDGSWRKVLEGEALAEYAWYGRVQLRSINNRRTLFFMMRQSPSTFESNVPENGAQNVLIRLSYRGTRHRG